MTATRICVVVIACVLAGCGSSGAGANGERTVSVGWRLAAPVNSRSRELRLAYTYPGYVCEYRLQRVKTEESKDAVRIEVLARYRPMPADGRASRSWAVAVPPSTFARAWGGAASTMRPRSARRWEDPIRDHGRL